MSGLKKIHFLVFCIFIALCTWQTSFAKNTYTKLTNMRILTIGQNTRVVFSLNKQFRYNYFSLIKPERLIIDFPQTTLAFPINKINFDRKIIKNIRTGIHRPNHNLRMVFELANKLIAKTYTLKPYGQYKHRLVLDLMAPKIKRIKKSTHKSTTTKIAKPKKLRPAVVVIDPGHGGKDTGAPGQRGTYEKNVVLAIGKDLYHLLKKQPGIEPKLTRSGDYFVPLRGRLNLARQGWADMFVAIHADAYINHTARGASVFALSQHGATSEAAHWLAQKENYSELMGGISLEDKSYLLRSVLIDLSQAATIQESLSLGNYVISNLNKVALLHSGHIEQAPFVVLKSPDIPSILVETGFISNRKEELLLRDPAYQKKIAQALMQGILSYLHKYPPPGTILTKLYQQKIKHVVQRGENLSAIARHYKISAASIKQTNHLKNSTISVGQILQISRNS